jgi:ribosome-interacting GTPase 1
LRLNKSPPDIYFKRKKTGGVSFNTIVSVARRLRRRHVLVCEPAHFCSRAMPGCCTPLQVPLTRIDEATVNRILYEYKIHHCEVRGSSSRRPGFASNRRCGKPARDVCSVRTLIV